MTNIDYIKALEVYRECLQKDYIHTENDVSYFYEYQGTTLKIWFQWSKDPQDWLYNFNFPAAAYRDMPVKWYIHRGFKKAWKLIEDDIKNALISEYITDVQIVGYSHGAALAMLCHEFCKFHRPDLDVTGLGFGCPRVLWGSYNDELLTRWDGFAVIRNYDDIVTHLPPRILGYRHVGQVVDLTPKGHYKQAKRWYDRHVLPHTEGEIIKWIEANIKKEKSNEKISKH